MVASKLKSFCIFKLIGLLLVVGEIKSENYLNPPIQSSYQRQPRFFIRSTSTTTAITVTNTTPFCFTETAITMVCAKRKKRTINELPNEDDTNQRQLIVPSKSNSKDLVKETDIDSSSFDIETPMGGHRNPRFFAFFTTTYVTIATTIPSFAATVSFTIQGCLPTRFAFPKCT